MSFTKSTYYKLGFILLLFALVTVISSSIRLRLLGANIDEKEIVNSSIKNDLNKIFYEEKAAKVDSIVKSIAATLSSGSE